MAGHEFMPPPMLSPYDENDASSPGMYDKEITSTSSLRRHLVEEFGSASKSQDDLLDANSTNLQPGQEHMKVFLRIRPFTDKDIKIGESQVHRNKT